MPVPKSSALRAYHEFTAYVGVGFRLRLPSFLSANTRTSRLSRIPFPNLCQGSGGCPWGIGSGAGLRDRRGR